MLFKCQQKEESFAKRDESKWAIPAFFFPMSGGGFLSLAEFEAPSNLHIIEGVFLLVLLISILVMLIRARMSYLKEKETEMVRMALLEEKQRISRDLHDSLAHRLTSASIRIQQARHQLGDASQEIDGHLLKAAKFIEESLLSASKLVENSLLDNNKKLSLELELQALMLDLGDFSERITIDIDEASSALPQQVKRTVFLVIREAITNAQRYAQAEKIVIQVQRKDQLSVIIEDDGVGFDSSSIQSKKNRGISIMETRVELLGGQLTVVSKPSGPTIIQASIPIAEES